MNIEKIKAGLKAQGYIADQATAQVLAYAGILNKPLLVEGPAGAGKTELAKAWGRHLGRELVRLQCYEGIDESKALYEWDYPRQLLYIQAKGEKALDWQNTGADIFTDEFLFKRPLLYAITSGEPKVLLIDEVDKSDEEFESFLLEILSDWQVTIPETGTIRATCIPSVILTSNNTRNLSEALRRRCLYLHLDYPDQDRELSILRLYFPELNEKLGRQVVAFVRKLRLEKLKKHPSISEVIDWVTVLEKSHAQTLTRPLASESVNILFKYREDLSRVLEKIDQEDWFHGISHP